MQQQYFGLSPMAGQESFGVDGRSNLMAQTPTTSSMMAALQAGDFAPTLDPTSFGADAYTGMGYMDPNVGHDDSLSSGHQAALGYADYTSSGHAYDGTTFNPQDLGVLSAAGTPGSESEHHTDASKLEQ